MDQLQKLQSALALSSVILSFSFSAVLSHMLSQHPPEVFPPPPLFSFSISFFGEKAEKEKGRKTFNSVEREQIWPRVCFKFLCLIKVKK